MSLLCYCLGEQFCMIGPDGTIYLTVMLISQKLHFLLLYPCRIVPLLLRFEPSLNLCNAPLRKDGLLEIAIYVFLNVNPTLFSRSDNAKQLYSSLENLRALCFKYAIGCQLEKTKEQETINCLSVNS